MRPRKIATTLLWAMAVTALWTASLLLGRSALAQSADDLVTGIDRERLAQTGMKFLSISLDPRAAAMGDAVTALEGSAFALFYNPAGMGYLSQGISAGLGQVQWIGDLDYNYASVAFRPLGGRYGVFGLSLLAANYGEIQETIRYDNDQGYMDLGTFSPTAMALGLGYARALTDRFSVGAHAKYVEQSFGAHVMDLGSGTAENRSDFSESTLAFDLGVLYRTGFRSLNFALSVQNFSQEVTYVEENFELPLTFQIGVAMDMMDFVSRQSDMHAVLLSVDARRPRDYAEQVKVGLEYRFMELLSLRGGYIYPTDEQGINLGVGLEQELGGVALGADYAYTSFGVFGTVNRLALHIGL